MTLVYPPSTSMHCPLPMSNSNWLMLTQVNPACAIRPQDRLHHTQWDTNACLGPSACCYQVWASSQLATLGALQLDTPPNCPLTWWSPPPTLKPWNINFTDIWCTFTLWRWSGTMERAHELNLLCSEQVSAVTYLLLRPSLERSPIAGI